MGLLKPNKATIFLSKDVEGVLKPNKVKIFLFEAIKGVLKPKQGCRETDPALAKGVKGMLQP